MKPKLLVFALALSAAAQVKITPGAGKIDIEIAGKPYSTFYMTGEDVTKPYLWPVRAATGTYVTRAWPMEQVAEEEKGPKDHPHQRGIWFATARLATGAQFIRDMIVDAWLASATGMVGYPMVNVRDIESGKMRATRDLFGAD